MENDKEVLNLLTKKGLHVHKVTPEDYTVIYDNYRKVKARMPDPYGDTHYIMDSEGQVVFMGHRDGMISYAYRD